MGVTRRMRLDAPVSTFVDAFRDGRESASMRDALAQIAMRLVDTQDREQFQRADGATTIRTFRQLHRSACTTAMCLVCVSSAMAV